MRRGCNFRRRKRQSRRLRVGRAPWRWKQTEGGPGRSRAAKTDGQCVLAICAV